MRIKQYRSFVIMIVVFLTIVTTAGHVLAHENLLFGKREYSSEVFNINYNDLIGSSFIRASFYELYKTAWFGHSMYEKAVFITIEAGELNIHSWGPVFNRICQQSYYGDLPPGTIAITHTHPRTVSGKPSPGDKLTADRLGLHMFVLSREGIWVYDPSTGITSQLAESDYWNNAKLDYLVQNN